MQLDYDDDRSSSYTAEELEQQDRIVFQPFYDAGYSREEAEMILKEIDEAVC